MFLGFINTKQTLSLSNILPLFYQTHPFWENVPTLPHFWRINRTPIPISFVAWGRSRCNFSLVACYSLKFIRSSLLAVKSHVITEVACCKKSLVTRCKICSLLVAEVARCKKSFVIRCEIRSLLIAKVARYWNSLVTRCKIGLLLVAEVARCKKLPVTCCKICLLLVTRNKSLLVAEAFSLGKIIRHSLTQSQINKVR